MKNLSLVLNAVLFVAIAILYYLHFSGPASTKSTGLAGPRDLKVAYVNSDTILKYYEFFKVNRDKLQAKGTRLDQDLKNRAQAFQSDYEAFQRNANNMTPNQFRAVEEDLGKKRQNLQLYQESLSQEMMIDQEKLTKELYTKITAYLKKYSDENGLQAVLKFDASSDLLYGNDTLDISKIVIKGLNEAYQSEQGSAPAKSDTTASKKK